ncbi:tyrosine-protein kinase receptor torso [Balamuthia mandrillaris]
MSKKEAPPRSGLPFWSFGGASRLNTNIPSKDAYSNVADDDDMFDHSHSSSSSSSYDLVGEEPVGAVPLEKKEVGSKPSPESLKSYLRQEEEIVSKTQFLERRNPIMKKKAPRRRTPAFSPNEWQICFGNTYQRFSFIRQLELELLPLRMKNDQLHSVSSSPPLNCNNNEQNNTTTKEEEEKKGEGEGGGGPKVNAGFKKPPLEHMWTVYVKARRRASGNSPTFETEKLIQKVTFELHPTFTPYVIELDSAPFELSRRSWGTFEVGITVEFKPEYAKPPLILTHSLHFAGNGREQIVLVDVTAAKISDAKLQNFMDWISTAAECSSFLVGSTKEEKAKFLCCIQKQFAKEELTYADLKDMGVQELRSAGFSTGAARAIRRLVDKSERKVFESLSTISFETLQLGELLGSGEFGSVYKGLWRNTTVVAIKELKQSLVDNEQDRLDFVKESKLLMNLPKHPNVVVCYGVSFREEDCYLVTEFVPHGSLLDYLHQNKEDIEIPQLIEMAKGIAAGMDHLAANGVIHRDLAARNVLISIDQSGHICSKVSDFGMARILSEKSYYNFNNSSSANCLKIPVKWTAPEALLRQTYSTASDVWSFGVLLWELFTFGHVPYPEFTNTEARKAVERGYRLERPKECPRRVYRDVMLRCWEMDAKTRPDFNAIHAELVRIEKELRRGVLGDEEDEEEGKASGEGDEECNYEEVCFL